MTTTTPQPPRLRAPLPRGTDPTLRLAGLAGVAFAASVLVQNVWAGAAGLLPAADATAAEVVATFAEHDGTHGLLVAWVAANMVLLCAFLAGAYHRLRAERPVWAGVGLLGGVLLLTFFAGLNVPVVVLASQHDSLAGEPALVEVLWTMHGALFAFAGVALGTALLGFSLAAAGAGLVPGWMRVAGPVAAGVMIAASVPVQAGAEGAPATRVAAVGFLVWLAFLAIAGLRLARHEDQVRAAPAG